jgi:hypothetical protein
MDTNENTDEQRPTEWWVERAAGPFTLVSDLRNVARFATALLSYLDLAAAPAAIDRHDVAAQVVTRA